MGEIIKLTPASIAQKAVRGKKELALLLQLSALLAKINKQIKIAENIPDEYDEEKLTRWQKRYSWAFGAEM